MWARMSSRHHFFYFLISCMQLLLKSCEINKYLIYKNVLSATMPEKNSNYPQYSNLLIISVGIVDIKDTKVKIFFYYQYLLATL